MAVPDGADALAKAITDLTADPGSLVEALDDLGDPAGYSPAGHTRLAALGRGTPRPAFPGGPAAAGPGRRGRADARPGHRGGRTAGPRPGQRPGRPGRVRRRRRPFAGDQDEPTLGAFLAYLNAAEEEEFGLEAGRVGESDRVTLATVHAAKGLQWAAVVVPGLTAGQKAQVFPAKPQVRQPVDRERPAAPVRPARRRGRPACPGRPDRGPVPAFGAACAARDLGEERRWRYVAATRAAFWLACCGYWWGDGASPLGPSAFLTEVRTACEAGAGIVAQWAPPPEDGAENPVLAEPPAAGWPATRRGPGTTRCGKRPAWSSSALAGRGARPGPRADAAGPADRGPG